MNLVSQLITIMRGGSREAAERIIDANSLRLLDQQIHECEAVIQQSRRDLTQVVAERISVERRSAGIREVIYGKEALARQAIDKDEPDLARELAGVIGEQCRQLDMEQAALKDLRNHEQELTNMLKDAVSQIREYRRHMGLLKATSRAQVATRRLDNRGQRLVTSLDDIAQTTERIRAAQQSLSDQIEASRTVAANLNGDDMGEHLRKAGLVQDDYSAESVLKRLRQTEASASK